jgi:hypothetical protein
MLFVATSTSTAELRPFDHACFQSSFDYLTGTHAARILKACLEPRSINVQWVILLMFGSVGTSAVFAFVEMTICHLRMCIELREWFHFTTFETLL